MSRFKFPSAFTILFVLTAVVAVMTYFVPAGSYERAVNAVLQKEVPVPGTYHLVASNPQGFLAVLMAPINGIYNTSTYAAEAIDVSLFVLIIGGFLGVMTRTGAIDAGIGGLLNALKGKEIWMIPILMTAFAAGGTSYGMAEESLAFYAVVIPVMIRAGYDSPTGVAVILLGAGIGCLGSTFNAFATLIASNAAGTTLQQGLGLRTLILALTLIAAIIFVMRYAARVKADPSRSIVADKLEEHRAHFLRAGEGEEDALPELTKVRSLILVLFAGTFGIMLWGIITKGWWMGEMSALFLAMAILIWFVGWLGKETSLSEEQFITAFVDGARDLLGVALIIGVARGIVVVMNAGMITDTILHSLEGIFGGLGEVSFINTMFGVNIILSFLVPSTSGLAVLAMPILAPLSDFAGVGRDLTVTAYQSGSGWVNLITPTSAVVMGGLAIGKVSYDRWLRFVFPLMIVLGVIIMGALSLGAMLGADDLQAPAAALHTTVATPHAAT